MLGSCLALALSYSGCCLSQLSSICSNNGCYCDQICHFYGDCCSDIADIGCKSDSDSSSSSTPTPTDTLGKIKYNPLVIVIKNINHIKTYVRHTNIYWCLLNDLYCL